MSGINRRLDQLGRIVLPIEIRKKLKLEEGSVIDISIKGDCLILKKCEPVHDLKQYIKDICLNINDCDVVCISKTDIVFCLINGKEKEGGKVDDSFFDIISEYDSRLVADCFINENVNIKNKYVYFLPIVTYGDKYGYLCFFYAEKATLQQEGVMKFIASYISGKL